MHTNGISYEGDLIDMGIAHKIISKSGAWIKYGETYIGQGKEKARNYLMENKEVAQEIRDAATGQGNAVKKRDETHRMAQANRAFAHLRW